ncbi:MAG: hypothetical protein E7019_01775 [Alphaproteobacteria bacterium]|nr:hypothetical protein [Alphaproteobacteria bacterium]
MLNTPLKKSIALHLIVFVLCVVDLPLFFWNRNNIGQVPIIVDLKDVKISEMTNLPPKAKMGKENKAASQVKRKIEKKYTKEEPKEQPKSEVKKVEPKQEKKIDPPTAKPEPPKRDHLVAPQPKKPTPKPEKKKEVAKPTPKPEPKKEQPKKEEAKKDESKPELANPLKSLLASVDALEKAEGPKETTATIKEGTKVQNMGIEGGTGGSYFSELSISEIDAIAGRLRACWNLDPGAMGIEDMIVEIRAELNQDGTVRKVEILDSSRYENDNHFRSVANSARRAVYICQPYSILADKYAEKYDLWKELRLRFNPLDNSVQ